MRGHLDPRSPTLALVDACRRPPRPRQQSLAWLFVAGHSSGALTAAGLALLLGGATGNVTDRIVHGAVTDFFEVWLGSYHWPAFNVADSAITVGAALIILDVLFFHKHHSPEVAKPRAS